MTKPDFHDEWGECVHCGFDLNGKNIYEHFLEEYRDENLALEYAQMYGATRTKGRFGLCIYLQSYTGGKKGGKYHICPQCKEKCYDT